MQNKNDGPQNNNFLIYIAFNAPSYLELFDQLIVDFTNKEKNIFILNPPSYTDIQDKFGKFLVNLFKLSSPYEFWLESIAKNERVAIYDFKNFYNATNDLFLEQRWYEFTKSQGFLRSLRSTLISDFKSSNPEMEHNYNKRKEKIIEFSRKIFIQTANVLSTNESISQLLVPNGRFLDQFVFSQTPKILGKGHIQVNYYERGLKPNSYYFGEFSLLDRVKYQESILQKYTENEVTDWFMKRVIEPSANEYSGLWNKSETDAQNGKLTQTRSMTIFSSSPDEFAFLGPDWHESEWTDQWEAYEAVIYKFSKTHDITIRLHPNSINKSYKERKRMSKSIRSLKNKFPHINVIPASSSTNTYDLIRKSEVVVVWYSTVGLEAVHMGVPVICLNSAEWDLVVDVNKAFSLESLNAISLPLRAPDKTTATKFISGRTALDFPIQSTSDKKYSERIDLSHHSLNQKIAENMRASFNLEPIHIFRALYNNGILYLFVKFIPRRQKDLLKRIHKKVKARLKDSSTSKI